jgi:hypothetical protein
MKKIYPNTILLLLLAFGIKANAQCTGCTINITGLDAANHIVTSGQVFCIAPTGTVTGQVTVSSGAKLCNQGNINSSNLWIDGGTLINYGILKTTNVLVSSGATFTNNATAIIDSLLINSATTNYYNNGNQTSKAFANIDHATVINTGTITVQDMADSIGTFTNNGIITISNGFAHIYNSSFINNGNITITNDFSNAYSSNFINNNYMNVMRDYYNSTNANFTTNCMIIVGRDWYNSAAIYGPALSSCGGFSITGGSYNSGTLGSPTTHLDLCDAGHPTYGIDGSTGTIDNTTTYCNCTNNCAPASVGIKELAVQTNVVINNIYPNPSSSYLTIILNNNESGILTLEIRDMMGRTVLNKTMTATIGDNETDVNVSTLSQGTYILNITDSHQLQTKRLFSVAR